MRILMVNHFPLQGSGSGVYVANIARELEKKGHKTCIITPENTNIFSKLENIKLHPVFFKYEEKIEGQLDFNFPCFDPHPRSNLLFGNMTKVQLEKYKNAFKEAIEQEIEEFKPDIIHAQHIWILSNIALEYNIPVVVTSHGSDIMGYDEWPEFHDIMHNVAEKCKSIIAISNHNKELISNNFKEASSKITTISNGYNDKYFFKKNYDKREILNEFNIDKYYDKIVCFAGRLTKNKGIDILIKAAKFYDKENILTIIAGDGEEYNYLNNLKNELELQNIKFIGNQQYENLRKMYNISDVCVVPSRKEAFGLVAIEAMACGTPVIAIKQGGIKEIINEKVGLLIEEENSEQLSNAIIKILRGDKKFDSNYLAKYAKDNYSQDLFIDKLIEVYEQALN